MIKALVGFCASADFAINQAAIESVGSVDAPVVHGRIQAARKPFPEDWRVVGLSLCAATAQDPALCKPMQDVQRTFIKQISKTSSHPRGALLAHVALEGVKLLELLDFHGWSPSERKRLLQEIAWLAGQDPKPVKSPRGSAKESGGSR